MQPRSTRSSVGGPSQNTRHRPRVSYRELDDLSDEDLNALNNSATRRQLHTPSRRSQRTSTSRPSYIESSSEVTSDSSEEDSDNNSFIQSPRFRYSPRKEATPSRSKKRPSSSHSVSSRPSSAKKRKTEQSTSTAPSRKSTTPLPGTSIIPPWQTLPYHILQQIFEYASFPLYEIALRPTQSIYWLLGTSQLCHSFHEAAITALLKSPPLHSSHRARDLLRLLRKSQDKLSVNYQAKIQRLEVEVKHLLIKKHPIDLPAIIRHSPLLKDLRLYLKDDEAGSTLWSRPLVHSKKWDYDAAIFDALDENNTYLRSFEWNGRFPVSSNVVNSMVEWHKRPAFQKLEALTMLNLATSDLEPEREEGRYEVALLQAIRMLPGIKKLVFRNCTIVNDRLVQHLPYNLHSLTIVDCVSLTSAELSAFLLEKGVSLKELVLDSNQSLNLAFANNLAACCPHLETFKMDLTYHDASAYHDVEPYFDELVPTGPPAWPSSLQTIDLVKLRSWDMAAAEGFFQSLADAAPELPNLRFLSLKVILKSGWRDRAQLRKKWKDKLQKIFLRQWDPPQDNRTVKHDEDSQDVPQDKTINLSGGIQVANGKGLCGSVSREASVSRVIFPNLTPPAESFSPPSTDSSNENSPTSQRRSSRIPVVTAQREEQLRIDADAAAAEAEKILARKEALALAKREAARRQKEAERAAAQAQKEADRAARREEKIAEKEGRRRLRSRYVMDGKKIDPSTAGTKPTKTPEEVDDQNAEQADEVPFVQGLCNTVIFRIDDQRPADAQFNEGDFIDEEMSGDEDWNGVDLDPEEEWAKRNKGRRGKYAW